VTQPSGDVSGLGTARRFAAGMSAAFASQVATTGHFVATLRAEGVSGPVITAAETARQASDSAAAAWARADQVLNGHGQVGEAYTANPGAGNREFVMQEGAALAAVGGASSDASPAGNPSTRPDPLKVAGRMVLDEGERFVGSGSVKNAEGAMVLAAAVDTPAGRQIHLGVPIYPEDKKQWRGGHAPELETEVDEEEGEEYQVDTGSAATAVLAADDAARLPAVVEDVVARATETDKRCRQVGKECERLHAERTRLEAQRFGDEAAGEQKITVDDRVAHEQHFQTRRRRDIERAVDRLSPADRVVYDQRQQRIDAAGRDGWDPAREAEAAEVCGLSVPDFREMKRLERIPHQQRTRQENTQLDVLAHGGGDCIHPILPPLLAEQAALVCGLTVAEYREMERLETLPTPHHFNQDRRTRTAAEQARLDELDASPRGATGANPRETAKLRGSYLRMLKTHHSAKTDLAHAWEDQAAMEATARPLDPATAADLQRVTAELDEANRTYDQMAGWPSATVEIPARNGGALVIEAIQREEEGGVDYRVDRKPADAPADWSTGHNGDPYTTTAAGLRKVAKLAADLAG
jgi:hypothetical protein